MERENRGTRAKHGKVRPMNVPAFAVVGHPNKGKSSIVSTLAMDDTVAVSPVPGTTTQSRAFALRVDGETLYELYDTPGFQRPRAVLEWLDREKVPAHLNADRVRRFVYEHRSDPRFSDEIELLTPLLDGAGILYVVDGAKPYGSEYETEMEILRRTGRPSMALINRIGDTDHIEDWKRALGHYFRLVRVFNPMKAGFSQHIQLLESMAQLDENWTPRMRHAVSVLREDRRRRIAKSADTVARLAAAALSYTLSEKLHGDTADEAEKTRLTQRYRDGLRTLERKAFDTLAQLWRHRRLERATGALPLEGVDLFSAQSMELFGLKKRDLIVAGTLAGAATGSGVDLALGGTSLMLGSAVGALLGGAGSALGFSSLAKTNILGTTLGGKVLRIGPVSDTQFGFVLLGRALHFASELAARTHADRHELVLTPAPPLLRTDIKKLGKFHRRFRDGHTDAKLVGAYARHIEELLLARIEH